MLTAMDQQEDDGIDLIIRQDVLESPVGQLADMIAAEVAAAPSGPTTKSAILPILIGLLPVLADLLAQNCNPTPERLTRSLQRKSRFARRWHANRINDWTVEHKGITTFSELGGKEFGGNAMSVLGDPSNESLIHEALASPPPVSPPTWGTLGR